MKVLERKFKKKSIAVVSWFVIKCDMLWIRDIQKYRLR